MESHLDLSDRFPSPAPSSCRVNGASHTVRHIPELCPCLAPCPTPPELRRQWHRRLRADPSFVTLNSSLAHLNLARACAGSMVKADWQEAFQSDNYLIDFGSKIEFARSTLQECFCLLFAFSLFFVCS